MTWGIVDDVVERFVAAGVPEARISCERDTFVFELPVPPSEFLALFRDSYGPTMNAFEAAAASGRSDELFRELEVLFNEQNQSPSTEATSVPATFLARDRSSRSPPRRATSIACMPGTGDRLDLRYARGVLKDATNMPERPDTRNAV